MRKIVIGILTYNRASLLSATLESLKYLRPCPDYSFEVIVVDNFQDGHAAPVVSAANIGVKCDYIFEGKHGIPYARNKVVETALSRNADFLAFIDDDEEADSFWLYNLVRMYEKTKAEVISGRCITVYPPETPNWVIQTDFFESPRKRTGSFLTYAATNSILYDMKVFREWKLSYNEKLALVGGSDNFLAKEIIQKGGSIIYTDDAVVRESVPSHRANLDWMVKRSYRNRANSIQHFLQNEGVASAGRYFFSTVFKALSRIFLSALKALFMRKSEMAKVVIACAAIGGLFGGIFNVQYQEYSRPK